MMARATVSAGSIVVVVLTVSLAGCPNDDAAAGGDGSITVTGGTTRGDPGPTEAADGSTTPEPTELPPSWGVPGC
jgi:hypothetical protein